MLNMGIYQKVFESFLEGFWTSLIERPDRDHSGAFSMIVISLPAMVPALLSIWKGRICNKGG